MFSDDMMKRIERRMVKLQAERRLKHSLSTLVTLKDALRVHEMPNVFIQELVNALGQTAADLNTLKDAHSEHEMPDVFVEELIDSLDQTARDLLRKLEYESDDEYVPTVLGDYSPTSSDVETLYQTVGDLERKLEFEIEHQNKNEKKRKIVQDLEWTTRTCRRF